MAMDGELSEMVNPLAFPSSSTQSFLFSLQECGSL